MHFTLLCNVCCALYHEHIFICMHHPHLHTYMWDDIKVAMSKAFKNSFHLFSYPFLFLLSFMSSEMFSSVRCARLTDGKIFFFSCRNKITFWPLNHKILTMMMSEKFKDRNFSSKINKNFFSNFLHRNKSRIYFMTRHKITSQLFRISKMFIEQQKSALKLSFSEFWAASSNNCFNTNHMK